MRFLDYWGWRNLKTDKFSKNLKMLFKICHIEKLKAIPRQNCGVCVCVFGGEGATAQWGELLGESTVGVSSTSKNRPSHHNYKSPKQFELTQSWKAKSTQCPLGATCLSRFWGQPSDKKSVKWKITSKKINRTKIITTNFVREQLTI